MKSENKHKKRIGRISAQSVKTTLLVLFSMLGVILISLGFVGDYFYNLTINADVDRGILFKKNQKSDISPEPSEQSHIDVKLLSWIAEKSRNEYIDTDDGLRLHGYEIENPENSHRWVILVHGYNSQGLKMKTEAEIFYNMGYSVLLPDLRGCGESQGSVIGMGWLDRLDMLRWIEHIVQKDSDARIVLYGVSMGGATVMMTTGEQLPSNVKAAIEDCGYTSAKEEFEQQFKEFFGLPSFPVITSADAVCFFRAGYTFEQASSVEQVKKSVTPTLFIHGDEDTFVPFEMLDKVYASANCPKEKLVINGAGHVGSSSKNPKLYWSTVENFLAKYV